MPRQQGPIRSEKIERGIEDQRQETTIESTSDDQRQSLSPVIVRDAAHLHSEGAQRCLLEVWCFEILLQFGSSAEPEVCHMIQKYLLRIKGCLVMSN